MPITLAGLTELGLGHLEDVEIFEKKKEKEVQKQPKKMVEPKAVELTEKDYIYDKSFRCPACDNEFTAKIMKSTYTNTVATDWDLRPLYQGIDVTKYDVVLCPKCGFATLKNYFAPITDYQIKQIREKISNKVNLQVHEGEIYTYEEAMERYKLALATSVVIHAKNSVKAYICLKIAWLLRGYAEFLAKSDNVSAAGLEMIRREEEEYLHNAYEGFVSAREAEGLALCGMDEATTDYLIAALALRFKNYKEAGRLVSKILRTSPSKSKVREKAKDIRDEIVAGLKLEEEQKALEAQGSEQAASET